MVDMRNVPSTQLASDLGRRIGNRRKVLLWTQAQLADRMGCDAETISRFERGVNLPSLSTLMAMCEALSCNASDLLDNETDPAAPFGDAEVISVWLSGLTEKDRSFVLAQVESTCAFLSKRK